MASPGPLPEAKVPQASMPRVCCSSSSPTGAQFHGQDASGGSGPARAPAVPEGPASRLPRNVLCERERRRRISVSCERLRALLPRFDGRREDMASVLEMSVHFLRMAGTVVPSRQQQAGPAPSEEVWHEWQKDILQLALESQTPAESADPGTGAPVTMQQDPRSCVTPGVDQGQASAGVAEVLDGLTALPGPSGLAPWTPGPSPSQVLRPPPAWPPCSGQPTSLLVSEEARSCLGPAGPLTEAVMPGTRSEPGCDVEDGPPLLLPASPEGWLGPLEGRDSSGPAGAPARSSPLDGMEPGFLVDPEPGSQEPPDGPLEPWGWDTGCPSLAFRDEVDSIFPDFFAC